MELEDIKKKKHNLEELITVLLEDFENATGLKVRDLELDIESHKMIADGEKRTLRAIVHTEI